MTQTATHTLPELVTLPSRLVLAVDGSGPAESATFAEAVRSLYATRAALGGADVQLEGSYWQGDDRAEFDLGAPQGWRWTLSVDAPDGATEEDVVRGAASVGATGVRLTREPAGRALRVEHRGPYDAEGPSLAALRTAAAEQGLAISGPHTETYVTDPTTTPPKALRTLLRFPVA